MTAGRRKRVVADRDEVLATFTRIMRGETHDADAPQPKVAEQAKAAELLGKHYGIFDGQEEPPIPSGGVAEEIRKALRALREEKDGL